MNNTDEDDFYQGLAEQHENELQGLIEQFEEQEEVYRAMGEEQENDIQALLDIYDSQLFLANPRYIANYEKASDNWFIINEDYSLQQSYNQPSTNIQNTIYKKFCRTSESGKTPYFSYHILDHNGHETNLKIGNYSFSASEPEHWVSWDFNSNVIQKETYLREYPSIKTDFSSSKDLMFPIEYSFAELIQLDEYNPFNFSFTRLNFLKQDSATISGDKFSRVKILGSKNQFIVLSIFNFENNIINLLKQLNDSKSFSEFHLKSHLSLAVKYLSHMHKSNFSKSNFPIFNSYLAIIKHIENQIDENYKFLNKDIKDTQESSVNILLVKYKNLKRELDSFN